MNVKRLLQAVAVVSNIQDEKIDLSTWQQNPTKNTQTPEIGPMARNMEEAAQECGTLACAAGWLALSPEFQAQGFSVGRGGYPVFEYEGDEFRGFTALALMFEIDEDESEDLFSYRRTRESLSFLTADAFYGFLTDKQLWLTRMREFLYDRGVLA